MKKYLILFISLFSLLLVGCTSEIEEKKYFIAYELDGGSANELVTEFRENTEVRLPIPTKEGYEFIGWYQENEKIEIIENKDYSLTAKWKVLKYTITYELNGGTCNNLVTEFTYFDDVSLPTPSKEDSTFLGWYEGDEKVDAIARKNYTLEAKWELIPEKEYYVHAFFQGKIIFSEKVIENTKLKDLSLLEKLNKKFSYEIVEIYTDKDFENSVNLNKKVTEDMYLYLELKVKPVKELVEGVKISILGDSISTFYSSSSEVNSYYSENDTYYYPKYCSVINTYTKTWWWKTIEALNGTIGINNSWSGTTVYNWGNENNSGAMNMNRIETLDENGTPDIIIVFMGTNDLASKFEKNVFKNAYDKMLSRIEKTYPDAYIFCFKLGYSIYTGYEDNRADYNSVIEELANKHCAGIIDLSYVQTIETYQEMLADRLHPNEEGMNRISNRAVNTITSFYKNGNIFK